MIMNKRGKPTFSHQELAVMYFPDVRPESASSMLSRWINRDPELLDELRRMGYRKHQRTFTPRQVNILFDHLGDPKTIRGIF